MRNNNYYHSSSTSRRSIEDDESNIGMRSTSYIHHVDQQAGDGEVDYIVNHLRNTASRGYNNNRDNGDDFGGNGVGGGFRHRSGWGYHQTQRHRGDQTTTTVDRETSHCGGRSYASSNNSRPSLEEDYCRAMNRVSRGTVADVYYNNKDDDNYTSGNNDDDDRNDYDKRPSNGSGDRTGNTESSTSRRRRKENSTASARTEGSDKGSNCTDSITDSKKAAAAAALNKDPSEETIAIFGAYGVTGHHFMQLAMEAGYKIRALTLPGIELQDVVGNANLKLITGAFDEEDKVRRVVKNASYVVCLLNDCDHSLHRRNDENSHPNNNGSHPSTAPNVSASSGSSASNLAFIHQLVPILEESKTCRLLLYQASSVALDDKGTTPIVGKMLKKFAIRKDWRQHLREQDRIVKYIVRRTRESAFNYIITRPGGVLLDRPSRKKLAASKSLPGPFPITNVDLAEFTLGALRTVKLYNSCPYVVQDGI